MGGVAGLQLHDAAYTVELDVWDRAPSEDFVARMQQVLESADRLLAICSEAYLTSAFGGAEALSTWACRPLKAASDTPW